MKEVKKIKLIGLLITLVLLASCQPPHEFAGTRLSAPQPSPHTVLQSASGPVSLQDFQGQYTFVYFGYTFCPDICPATLSVLKRVKADLGEAGDEIAVVMITVDPERDTPERLAEYMGYFDSSFVGLSGEKDMIDEVGAPFGLYYERHEGSGEGNYLVDHTARVYLLDRESNAIVAYPHEVTADLILDDLHYLIEQES
ncbi:MAG: SCO family protein [Ardenticatenaceae bacterium]|nr:SCO family protein [Ardenticatenaceae bacterium]